MTDAEAYTVAIGTVVEKAAVQADFGSALQVGRNSRETAVRPMAAVYQPLAPPAWVNESLHHAP